jgi:hypothetical protein
MGTDHEFSDSRKITWMWRAKQAPLHIRENCSGTSWIVGEGATGTQGGMTF